MVCFFSASSTGDFQQLYDFGIREILVSYFYIRKNLKYYEEMLPKFKAEGGIFMTDSGAFSFMGKYDPEDEESEKFETEEFWLSYLMEYKNWIEAHKDYIFSAVNLDLDMLVGEDVVNKWNDTHFKYLAGLGIQIIYVSHPTDRATSLERFEYYCKKYDYVGVNQSGKKEASAYYVLAEKYKRRVHGFAWTQISLLRRYPFFSVDSVSWLSGVRFGTTFTYDGKNFNTFDKKNIRKRYHTLYESVGIDMVGLKNEKRVPINQMNLLGWMGFRKEVLKIANIRLDNKFVSEYIKK